VRSDGLDGVTLATALKALRDDPKTNQTYNSKQISRKRQSRSSRILGTNSFRIARETNTNSLLTTALAGSYPPALRAMRVDPITTLQF
jgi:hypothetical protein